MMYIYIIFYHYYFGKYKYKKYYFWKDFDSCFDFAYDLYWVLRKSANTQKTELLKSSSVAQNYSGVRLPSNVGGLLHIRLRIIIIIF